MNRVKDYISFAIWFVGLSYVSLWPMAVPDGIAAWLAPQGRMVPACNGLVIASLQALCRAHETVAQSPGLHLMGTLAAFWVTLRLMVLLVVVPLRRLLPRSAPDAPPISRLVAMLRRRLTPLVGRGSRPSPSRYVPPRREFGLRRSR